MAKTRNKPRLNPAEGNAPTRRAADDDRTGAPPSGWVRVALSLWIAWHLLVVFVSPLSVQPASILVSDFAQSKLVRWYTDSLYLNHGYHFFGPDPPINQIVRYRVADAAGQTVAEGAFPDKDAQRPRLYYHRHMMLADQASLGPPDVPPQDWLRLSLRSYGRYLLRRHAGDRVTIDCVRHAPLYPGQVLQGADPNAPELFEAVASVEETAGALADPLPVPAAPAVPEPPLEDLPPGDSL